MGFKQEQDVQTKKQFETSKQRDTTNIDRPTTEKNKGLNTLKDLKRKQDTCETNDL